MSLFHRIDVKHLKKFEKVKVSCCKSRYFLLLNKRFVWVVILMHRDGSLCQRGFI